MKTLVAIAFLLTSSAFAVNAQQCDADAQAVVYDKFLSQYKGTPEQQKMASETGKEYISKFGTCPTEAEKKVADFITKWLTKYEAASVEFNCTNAVNKTPAQAFELCRPYLAKNPESLRAHLLLSAAGVRSISTADKKLNEDTVKAARKALDLIKSGKTVDQWIFGDSKEQAVATLEFYSAFLTAETTPAETAATMLNLARSNTEFSKNPSTFLSLASTLYESEVKKQVGEYKLKCEGKAASPECDAAYSKIDSVIDRVIDAYARAVALAADKPEYSRITAAARPALTELYKRRHENSEAGLDKYVAEVLSKPIP